MSPTRYARFHPVVQPANPYTMAISHQRAIVPFLAPTPPASDVGDSAASETEECVGCKMIQEKEAWLYHHNYAGMSFSVVFTVVLVNVVGLSSYFSGLLSKDCDCAQFHGRNVTPFAQVQTERHHRRYQGRRGMTMFPQFSPPPRTLHRRSKVPAALLGGPTLALIRYLGTVRTYYEKHYSVCVLT